MSLIDILRLKTNLEQAGMDDAAIADALGHADVDQLATKADLAAVQADLKAEIAIVKAAVTAIKAEIVEIKAAIKALKAEIADLKADFKKEITIIVGILLAILVKVLFF